MQVNLDDDDAPDWAEIVNDAFPNSADEPYDDAQHAGPAVKCNMIAGWQGISRMRDHGYDVHDAYVLNGRGDVVVLFREDPLPP